MRNFLIGDVQGCRAALDELLARIAFDTATDHVFFAGDLVARGPDSLGTLRLIKGLGCAASTVLGNHDLHLLAAYHGHAKVKPKDLTQPILDAADAAELMHWLQQQPLLIQLPSNDVLTHAGLPPNWTLEQAQALAADVEIALRGAQADAFFAAMYGNVPSAWQDDLSGAERLRVITNHFTRMRLMDATGHLNFQHKSGNCDLPEGFKAWFDWPSVRPAEQRVFFGHWASLNGITHQPNAMALDSGCVWGNYLTAYCLETGEYTTSTPGLT
ncbi:MAG: symmetrical bis(5'-nucleosyl)-tetraphosphatase [Paraperlucidibaca sp.]